MKYYILNGLESQLVICKQTAFRNFIYAVDDFYVIRTFDICFLQMLPH